MKQSFTFSKKNDVDLKHNRFAGVDGCTVTAGELNGSKSRSREVVGTSLVVRRYYTIALSYPPFFIDDSGAEFHAD